MLLVSAIAITSIVIVCWNIIEDHDTQDAQAIQRYKRALDATKKSSK
jgi:hypothetical protein